MKIVTFSAGLLAVATMAQADSLTHYGAISGSFGAEFPYAEDGAGDPANAGFGAGLSYGLIYKVDQGPLGGRPMEYAFEVGVLQGSATTGDAVPGSCNIDTYIGLISDCQDVANLDGTTIWADASAMMNFGTPGGSTDLLAGLGVLHFGHQSDSEFLYPTGFENFITRDTSFTGAGVKMGARHRVEMQNGMTFNLAGFAGAYAGNRTTDIRDIEEDTGGGGAVTNDQSLAVEKNTTVYVFEIRPSISMDVDWTGPDTTFEVGISHKQFLNVIDTSGYGDHLGYNLGGDVDDGFSSTSIFAGLSIQM